MDEELTGVSRALPKLAPFRENDTAPADGAAVVPLPIVNIIAVNCAKLAFAWPVAGDSVTRRDVFVDTCKQQKNRFRFGDRQQICEESASQVLTPLLMLVQVGSWHAEMPADFRACDTEG